MIRIPFITADSCQSRRRWRPAGLAFLWLCACLVMPASAPASAQPVETDMWIFGANMALPQGGGGKPVPVGIHHAVSADGGGNYALFVYDDGTVWGIGFNRGGNLGNGTITDHEDQPVQAKNLTGVTQVSAGNISLALKNDGTVWAWGKGSLGDGDHGPGIDVTSATAPVQVKIGDVKAISSGIIALALKNDGTVWMWNNAGLDYYDSATVTQMILAHHMSPVVPVQVSGLSNVKAIADGGSAFALKNDGTVWAWGGNSYCSAGHLDNDGHPRPAQLSGLDNVVQIAAGAANGYALKSDGTVWAWGANHGGELGNGRVANVGNANVQTGDCNPKPQPVPGVDHVKSIAAGAGHALALKDDGSVWSWGSGEYHEVGDYTASLVPGIGSAWKPTPSAVPGLPAGVIAIFGGYGSQSIILAPAGQVQPGPTAVPRPQDQPQPTQPQDQAPLAPTDVAMPPTQGGDTTAPPAELAPDGSGMPDTLNDQVQSDILDAINRANAAWVYAMGSLDTTQLANDVAGDLLNSDLSEVAKARGIGKTGEVNSTFTFDDAVIDSPGHAIVHTTEVWSEQDYNLSGQLVATSKPVTYRETYIVEYQNGRWIATSDVLVPVS